MERTVKLFSTFSGVGGFELGIKRAIPTIEFIGVSEIDPNANKILKYRFPEVKNYGDITKIKEQELPDFDILCGGFPCQSFSIAGKRMGFEDTRGTLFFDLARIAKAKRPRVLFFENVKGLLSHEEGRTITTILQTLDGLGYDVEWQVLNSKNHGVPQNRERIIIIGHRREEPYKFIFPIREETKGAIRNSSKHKELVLDLFGGSGSTLIACEELGRKCRMMELDIVYCNVIIERWEKLTGLKSKKIIQGK